MAPPRSRDAKEQEAKDAAERVRVERERQEGARALEQAKADDAAKTDEQRAAEEELARQQQEEAANAEAARVEAEQKTAEELREQIEREAAEKAAAETDSADGGYLFSSKLPADTRIHKAGTVVHINGEPAVLPVDCPLVIEGAADEQRWASVLARDPKNFAINSDRLRLVYNPMNGTPLPLDGQRLALEDMTEQERALFAPPVSRRN